MTLHRSVCPLDCPDACALRVSVEDGRVTRVAGHSDHPVTQGAICHKVQRFPERTHAPERLLYPMRRVRPKGLGVQRAAPDDFERISWEEALAEIAQRFQSINARHGTEAILPYSFYGNMGVLSAESMDRRFFNRLGACHLDRTICNSAATAGSAYTLVRPPVSTRKTAYTPN